ncbi:MAG: hypothetical protein K2X27_13510 [Candidatus Obscuribacterales bacterium]|nr:hypothetical protein [Candidatus Obscuribacterales bacterium]
MEIRIPLKVSQLACFLAGWFLCQTVSGSPGKASDPYAQPFDLPSDITKFQFAMIHDMWIVQTRAIPMTPYMKKNLLFKYNVQYPGNQGGVGP